MSLYNSVPYAEYEMSKIKLILKTCMDTSGYMYHTCNLNYNIYIKDIVDAVTHLKSSKSYGNESVYSGYFSMVSINYHIIIIFI